MIYDRSIYTTKVKAVLACTAIISLSAGFFTGYLRVAGTEAVEGSVAGIWQYTDNWQLPDFLKKAENEKAAASVTDTTSAENTVDENKDDSEDSAGNEEQESILESPAPEPSDDPSQDAENNSNNSDTDNDKNDSDKKDEGSDPTPTPTPSVSPTPSPSPSPTTTPTPDPTPDPTPEPTPTPDAVPTVSKNVVLNPGDSGATPNASGNLTIEAVQNENGYWDFITSGIIDSLMPNREYRLWICGVNCSSDTDYIFTTDGDGSASLSNVDLRRNQGGDPTGSVRIWQQTEPGLIPDDPTACWDVGINSPTCLEGSVRW